MALVAILDKHCRWLADEAGGERANLTGANLSMANLTGANLSMANLTGANLSEATLSEATLSEADLIGANLIGANLSEADLIGTNLIGANLTGANLSMANLTGANLSMADLSGAVGLLSPTRYLAENFESTANGVIVYKVFGTNYLPPAHWRIVRGAILEEVCNPDRGTICGSGVNVASRAWHERTYPEQPLWECLIRWKWLAGVVVPFGTDGKIRCERVELLREIPPILQR